jgi:hypothetical protein
VTISRCRRHIEVEMKNPFKRPGVVESYYEGLRLAGLPELLLGTAVYVSVTEKSDPTGMLPDRRKLVAALRRSTCG